MTRFIRHIIAVLALLLLAVGTVALAADSNRMVANPSAPSLLRVEAEAAPAVGTFFSMQRDLPPFPFNPFPGFDLYAFDSAPDTFCVGDLAVDYSVLKSLPGLGVAHDLAEPEGSGGGGRRLLAQTSVPPSPGDDGGGSTNTVPMPSSVPLAGLKFTNVVC